MRLGLGASPIPSLYKLSSFPFLLPIDQVFGAVAIGLKRIKKRMKFRFWRSGTQEWLFENNAIESTLKSKRQLIRKGHSFSSNDVSLMVSLTMVLYFRNHFLAGP